MILSIENITKNFGGLVALDQVTFEVQEGQIFGLIGPNGAGKTTLLNVISGVYKPNQGKVTFLGEKISGMTSERICRNGISRTFQISQPFPLLTALENVLVSTIFGTRKPVKNAAEHAAEILDFVEFPMPKDAIASSLNTAHLKRLDLARALASNPKLMLLDEVASGLTPAELTDAMQVIRKIRGRGITIIVVEHVMRLIMAVCDHIAVLQFGRKIAEGTPQEIAHDPKVTEAYLGEHAKQAG